MPEEQIYKRAMNYRSRVDWVIKTYKEWFGFVHGFQKDSIQNAIGARENQNNFNGWRCLIYVKRTEKGVFVIVEDFGTTGLTGENYSAAELDKMMENGESIDPTQRLARISVDNSSGGDSTSAGLYGVGKTLYVAASNDYFNYFDSLTTKEGYRCNMNNNNSMFFRAKEGEEAKKCIKEATALDPIDHVGTRFIVVNPKQEIIDAIEGPNHEMLHDVQETWWRSIIKIGNKEDGIFVGGIRAEVPAEYQSNESKEINEKNSLLLKTPADASDGLRYKKIGFYIRDNLPEYLRGFYYYRRGMKIGKIDISDYDVLIGKPYYGFIELEPDWEEELAKYENPTHYDCERTGKNTTVYQVLKNQVRKTVNEVLEEWGYLKTKENNDKYLAQLTDKIKEDISDLLSENGFENIGKGNKRPQIEIKLADVTYPHSGDPKYERSSYENDKISFSFTIFNHALRTQKIKVKADTVLSDDTPIAPIFDKEIEISPAGFYEDSLVLITTDKNSARNVANGIKLSAIPSDGTGKSVIRKLIYYYATETMIQADRDFEFDIASFHFPNEEEKGRRVDTGESVTGIAYSMINHLRRPVNVALRVTTLDGTNNNEPIATIINQKITLPPDGEEVISTPVDIEFDRETYLPILRRGIINIRARMVSMEDLPNEKGRIDVSTKLGQYDLKVFFNKPEKAGPEIDILYRDFDPSDHRASRISDKQKNAIEINTAHPEYLACATPIAKGEYITRVALRQSILLYASQGLLDNQLIPQSGATLTNFEYSKKLEEKIQEIWYQKCQKI